MHKILFVFVFLSLTQMSFRYTSFDKHLKIQEIFSKCSNQDEKFINTIQLAIKNRKDYSIQITDLIEIDTTFKKMILKELKKQSITIEDFNNIISDMSICSPFEDTEFHKRSKIKIQKYTHFSFFYFDKEKIKLSTTEIQNLKTSKSANLDNFFKNQSIIICYSGSSDKILRLNLLRCGEGGGGSCGSGSANICGIQFSKHGQIVGHNCGHYSD